MRSSAILCLGVLAPLLIAGCAASHAPGGYLPDTRGAQSDVHGGWITIELKNKTSPLPMGELIAVHADSIFVLEDQGLAAFSLSDVSRAYLERYNNHWGALSVWGTLGTLSTLTHGFLLILSAPLWIVTSVASSSDASHEPILEYPDEGWPGFVKFSRFPQGIPPAVDRSALFSRPPEPAKQAPSK